MIAPAATDDILRALRDPDPAVVEAAAWSLEGKQPKSVMDALLRILLDTTKPDAVRQPVVVALAETEDPLLVEPFLAALKSIPGHTELSCWLAARLGNLGDSKAVQPLIDIIQDPDIKEPTDICYYAVEALGKLGNKRAFEPLIDALAQNERYTRCYAAEALGLLRDKRALPYLEPYLEDDQFWVSELGFLRDVAAEAIRRIESANA